MFSVEEQVYNPHRTERIIVYLKAAFTGLYTSDKFAEKIHTDAESGPHGRICLLRPEFRSLTEYDSRSRSQIQGI